MRRTCFGFSEDRILCSHAILELRLEANFTSTSSIINLHLPMNILSAHLPTWRSHRLLYTDGSGADLWSVQGLLHQLLYGAQEARGAGLYKQTLCLSCHCLVLRRQKHTYAHCLNAEHYFPRYCSSKLAHLHLCGPTGDRRSPGSQVTPGLPQPAAHYPFTSAFPQPSLLLL